MAKKFELNRKEYLKIKKMDHYQMNNFMQSMYTWSNGKARCWHERVSTDKARVRSKTFPGIAMAMAEQWGIYD